MRILLAVSDRDLLNSYGKLLTMDGHEITSAFDGAQALRLISGQTFDFLLLEEGLPRVGQDQLIPLARELKLPTLVMLNGRIDVRHLLRPDLPDAYLSLPFLPEDLRGMMGSVAEKKQSAAVIPCGDQSVKVSEFRFSGTEIFLTVQEEDLLSAVEAGKPVRGKHARTLILALNEKLSRCRNLARIVYENGKGYRLVMQDE